MTAIDLIIVCCCIVADVFTGLAAAWINHDFDSAKMREGAGHKLGELFAVGCTYGLQWGLPLIDIQTSINFVRWFTIYIVIMEFSSIAENIIKMDPELRGPLGQVAKMLRGVLNKDE